tara:strand:- start:484 stop:645 length:162 start_codon:yes stop_codon:yes gene_type:complete
MSFGGGGDSSVGVTNHKHTNAAGEGGNLDLTTLMPDATSTLSNTINLRGMIFG